MSEVGCGLPQGGWWRINWPLGFQSQHEFEEVVQPDRIFLDEAESSQLELPWNVRPLTVFPAVDPWFSKRDLQVEWSGVGGIRDES